MIKLNHSYILQPTRFPDGTHQVWHLPDEILESDTLHITWQFEEEAELLYLFSLRTLMRPDQDWRLYIPYLPYARQDKKVSDYSCFNLKMFGNLINQLECERVSAFDVHNYERALECIRRFRSELEVDHFHQSTIAQIRPDCLVFPDHGADLRYCALPKVSRVVFDKKRDPATGHITSHTLGDVVYPDLAKMNRFLIIDDICDGGATFLGMAPQLRKHNPNAEIHLCVSHGIFSNNARDKLKSAGIKAYTTNSLPQRILPGDEAPYNIL